MERRRNKMAGTNTEKPTGKAEAKKQVVAKAPINKKIETAPVKKTEEVKPVTSKDVKSEENKDIETKKNEKKIEVKKVKKTSAFVNVTNLPVSTKVAVAICKFIKKKTIEKAIENLESVSRMATAVPMKGEIPHRKGNIMSGRFPVKASKEFIILLKSLQGNAIQHDVEAPIITEAIANKGTSIYGRAGRMKKRSNIKIVCTQKKLIKTKKDKK
ncbi:MAG: uL22 family ribosomal protein [Nanoarchaeota archaeon]